MRDSRAKRILISVMFFTLFYMACDKESNKAPLDGEEITAKVKKADLRDELNLSGELRAVTRLDLRSESSGKVERLKVKEGQALKKGDTILVIDASQLRFRREKLSLAVEREKINSEKIKRDLEDAKALQEAGTISLRQVQDLETQWKLVDISIRQQKLDLKELDDQLTKNVVTVPFQGVLTSLNVEEGEIVVSATSGSQAGTVIGTIANMNRLEIKTTVGEADYPKLKTGMLVKVESESSPGKSAKGFISFLSLSAKKQQNSSIGTFDVLVSVDKPLPGMVPGITVNVGFLLLEKVKVLCVPWAFVKQEKGKAFVWVKKMNSKESKPEGEKVKIKIGDTDFRNIEILEGLKEGDEIMAPPEKKMGKNRKGPEN